MADYRDILTARDLAQIQRVLEADPNEDVESGDPRTCFEGLSEEEQAALLCWIRLVMEPAKTEARMSSYGLKHEFSELGDRTRYAGQGRGFYVTNDQFKGAMLATGYVPVDPNEVNWGFRMKPRCPHRAQPILRTRSGTKPNPRACPENPRFPTIRNYVICQATPKERAEFDQKLLAAARKIDARQAYFRDWHEAQKTAGADTK